MKNTKPLKDFLQDALADDQEKKHYSNASKWQNDWLAKYGDSAPQKYKAMYRYAHKRRERVCGGGGGGREMERGKEDYAGLLWKFYINFE
jgi:hypothetical protein